MCGTTLAVPAYRCSKASTEAQVHAKEAFGKAQEEAGGNTMSVRTKLDRWRNVGSFAVRRLADYAELLSIEMAETRARLLREFIALVALTVSALFTLSFFCIALIASALNKPYFLFVVWGIAIAWLMLSLIALLAFRALRPVQSLDILRDEVRADLQSLREVLK